jgi:hypothetical protein
MMDVPSEVLFDWLEPGCDGGRARNYSWALQEWNEGIVRDC